mgnify:CR=1 FL=1
MSLSPEREAQKQADRLHAAGQMMPREIVELQDSPAWWMDCSAKITAAFTGRAKTMM